MRSRRGMRWHWKGSSYPPGRTEVYESEAGEAVGFVFGVRGPAEGEEPCRSSCRRHRVQHAAQPSWHPHFLGRLKEEAYLASSIFFCSNSETLARANRVGRKGACCCFVAPGVVCAS